VCSSDLAINCAFLSPSTGVTAVTKPGLLGNVQTVYKTGPCAKSSRKSPSKKSCDDFPYSQFVKCGDILSDGYNCSYGDAFAIVQGAFPSPPYPPIAGKNPKRLLKGPCGADHGYIGQTGTGEHLSLTFLNAPKAWSKKMYPGTIDCCTCCSDDSGEPTFSRKCKVDNINHGDPIPDPPL
jgi:hypothetical protein